MSDLIPVSRKEQYLSKIDGMTNKSPDKTYTKEEYFFSEILGEALHKPVLETRYEMYLAKIAGREIGIPYPETRLERFLAKAAGMNISVPTPITREEMYWSTYSPFYLSNSSGTPPLTYGKCKIGTLTDYRIYGQTVDGESVGDRTGNLFDAEIVQGSFYANTGDFRDATNRIRSNASDFIYLTTGTYTINADGVDDVVYYAYSSEDTSTFLYHRSMTSWQSLPCTFTVQTPCYFLFGFRCSDESDIIPSDISNIMLNAGSAPLPYEPYGYKVPMTVEGKNLFDENSLISPISGFSWYFNDEHYLLATNKSSDNRPWGYNYSQLHITLSPGTYTVQLSGVGSSIQYSEMQIYKSNNTIIYAANIAGKSNITTYLTLNTPDTIGIEIKLYDGKYRFMLNEGTTPLPYEPYHTPITTPIYLPEPIKMVGDEAEYIDFMEQKQRRVRKNLLQNTATSRTLSTGITITVNDNKSMVINGTSSTGNPSGIVLGGNVTLDKGAYILSGCPQGGSINTYKLHCIFDDDGERKTLTDIGDGATIVLNSDNPKVIDNGFYIYALSSDNNVFFPMLRKADITDDTYEPYIENTDVDVTLPALPTLPGTNVLSVGTEVQPSHIFAEFDKEREYG